MKIEKPFDQDAWEHKFVALGNKYRLAFYHIMKAVLVGTVIGLVLIYFGVGFTSAFDCCEDGYAKVRPVCINNTGGSALTHHQVQLNVTYDADMNSSGADLRFVNVSAGVEEPYWIENSVDGEWFLVYFNATYVLVDGWSNTTTYMSYGNPSASFASNGTNTFIQYHGSATAKFLDSLIVSAPLIYESKVKPTATTHNLRFGLSNQQEFEVDDAVYVISYSGGDTRYIRTVNEASETNNIESPSFTNNVYYRLKIINTGSAVTGFVDDNQISTGGIPTNLPDENLGLGADIITGTFEQDWSFVRKYASPEPSAVLGAESDCECSGSGSIYGDGYDAPVYSERVSKKEELLGFGVLIGCLFVFSVAFLLWRKK